MKGFYKHYKGNYYEIIDIAYHADNLEQFVVYRGLYDDFKLWIRPLTSFLENVSINGQKLSRFEFISMKFVDLPQQILEFYLQYKS